MITDIECLEQMLAFNLVAAVALPPPIHGQSLVNTAVIHLLKQSNRNVWIADTSPGNRSRGVRYHLTRILRNLRAMIMLLSCSFAKEAAFYTVFESGNGIIYNTALITLARLLRYRIILHHHTSRHTLNYRREFAFLLRIAGSITHVALSPKMASDLNEKYRINGHILVCRNASVVPKQSRDVVVRPLRSTIRLGFLSNLSIEKGLDTAIEVVSEAKRRGLHVKLILAGPATTKEAERLISAAKGRLDDALEFIGPITGSAKSDFFKAVDVFLFPTRYQYEAQPLVLLEAMSFGIPAIVTDRGYIGEMMNGCGVVLLEKDFASAAVSELMRWVENPKDFEEIKETACKNFIEAHCQSADDMLSLVQQVLSERIVA